MHRQKDKSISRKGDGDTDRERERKWEIERERERESERERERERAGVREINTQIDGHPGTTRSTGTRTHGHPGTTPIHGHTGTRARATRALPSLPHYSFPQLYGCVWLIICGQQCHNSISVGLALPSAKPPFACECFRRPSSSSFYMFHIIWITWLQMSQEHAATEGRFPNKADGYICL